MNAVIEAFFYCLLASMIWAPLVFFVASRFTPSTPSANASLAPFEGKIWPAALVLAALPVLLAPVVAALGLSLRVPEPLPPMVAMTEPAVASTLAPTSYTAVPTTITIGDIVRTTAVLYFYGFLMLFALGAVRHIWFSYRLVYSVAIDEPQLISRLETWRKRIGVRQKPRYVFSHIVSSVCVYGFFRPVVVMPFNLLDKVSISDAALMGAHEIAHVKRGDVALFALCSIAKAVFWFNPFMHRICARANLAAEQGADALVLASGVDRRQYAHCFVQGLKLSSGVRNHFAGELVPSFTPFDKRSRRARLDAILSGTVDTPLLSLKNKIALIMGMACAVLLAFAQAAFAVSPPAPKEALTVAPITGEITLPYGAKVKAVGKEPQTHGGIDLRAARGTPVRAAGEGKVVAATKRYQGKTSWGKVVVLDHGHGLITRYAHLDSYLVQKGDLVEAGDVIGAVGSTGRSTGPHLHFEVLKNGASIDPTSVVTEAPMGPAPRTIKKAMRIEVAPTPPSAPKAPEIEARIKRNLEKDIALNEKQASKLEKRFAKLEGRLRERFKDFDAFKELDGVKVHFQSVELDGFEGAAELSEMLDGKTLYLDDLTSYEFDMPDLREIIESAQLSDDEIRDLKQAQNEVVREAARAIKNAKAEMDALRHEHDDHKHTAHKHEAHENAQHKKEMEIVRAVRDVERAERDTERALERAAKDQANIERARERLSAERARLETREEAIREAQVKLQRELAEIENQRKALERARDGERNNSR